MLYDKVIAIYCIIDDILKEINHKGHSSRAFTDSQVFTTAMISAMYFNGNQTTALSYVRSHIFNKTLNKSGFTKKLHKIKDLMIFLFFEIG